MSMVHDESSLHMAISLQSGASHSVLILWSRKRARFTLHFGLLRKLKHYIIDAQANGPHEHHGILF